MELKKHLVSEEMLSIIKGKNPDDVSNIVLEKGLRWFETNESETRQIVSNLQRFGFSVTEKLISNVQKHIILHYYEKLLPLCETPEVYYHFLRNRVDMKDAVIKLSQTIRDGKAVIIASAHFGGLELMAPALATYKLPLSAALRFTTESFSEYIYKSMKNAKESGFFGNIHFIEIGRPGANAALNMGASLRRKELLLTIFDEDTDYSVPVKLFGKTIRGGAGVEKLIAFGGNSVKLFNAFMIRTGNRGYKLLLKDIDIKADNPIQYMYSNLEQILKTHLEQWYFLHEKISFKE